MQKLLATLLVGAFAFVGYQPAAECHKNHCHGKEIKICGGGWKRYKEIRTYVGPEGGAKTGTKACAAAVDEFEEKLQVEAHSKCPELHPCATCPSACGGCKQENSTGKIFDEKSKTSKKRKNGTYQCEVKAEVAFRCSCGGCIKKGH
jgi:hypothetical protein